MRSFDARSGHASRLPRHFGRVGWKAIVAAPGEGTAVRTKALSGDPTNGLRSYPNGLLDTPADCTEATFSVTSGNGVLVAPFGRGGRATQTRGRDWWRRAGRGERELVPDGFAALFEDASEGRGVLVLLLPAAPGWGRPSRAVSGHGKAMVAAYLIGTRGTARDAVVLGAIVTVTHTIGVFALGIVRSRSQHVLPEQLPPWLTLISGLMVVAIGAGVSALPAAGQQRALALRTLTHEHDHAHSHADRSLPQAWALRPA